MTARATTETAGEAAGRPDTPAGPSWLTVSPWGEPATPGRPVSWRPVVVQMAVVALVVFALVAVAGSIAARQAAERESVNDALHVTDLLARAVVQPALHDDLLSTDAATAAAAVSTLDAVVRSRVLADPLIRVKLWAPDGRIVYSDEPRLIGRMFTLDEREREVLATPGTVGEVSDLRRPENAYERSAGKLLEVYRPVWTPGRAVLLFETYSRYSLVTARTAQVWRGFAGITVSSLMLMLVLQVPFSAATIGRLRRAQRQRELLLDRAVRASTQERRRIAATLHDGVLQELAATSFVVAGAAQRAHAGGQPDLGQRLDTAAGAVRAGIGALRSLLVELYPPNLRAAGLAAALADLAVPLRGRGVHVTVEVPAEPVAEPEREALLYAVAQECLRNTERHARASAVEVEVGRRDGRVRLEVADDGIGFDPAAVLADPPERHFGLRLMADLAAAAGALLAVASAPGAGTRWRLEVRP